VRADKGGCDIRQAGLGVSAILIFFFFFKKQEQHGTHHEGKSAEATSTWVKHAPVGQHGFWGCFNQAGSLWIGRKRAGQSQSG